MWQARGRMLWQIEIFYLFVKQASGFISLDHQHTDWRMHSLEVRICACVPCQSHWSYSPWRRMIYGDRCLKCLYYDLTGPRAIIVFSTHCYRLFFIIFLYAGCLSVNHCMKGPPTYCFKRVYIHGLNTKPVTLFTIRCWFSRWYEGSVLMTCLFLLDNLHTGEAFDTRNGLFRGHFKHWAIYNTPCIAGSMEKNTASMLGHCVEDIRFLSQRLAGRESPTTIWWQHSKSWPSNVRLQYLANFEYIMFLSLIHIWRCRR